MDHGARRGLAALVAAVLLAGLAVVAPARAADTVARVVDGRIDDWHGVSSRIGGSTQLSSGELVYQDHLFDDLGAETNRRAQQHGTVETPKGDFRYPTDDDRYGNNAADLQELRLAPAGDDLWLLARLSTLKEADTTVVAVGFDLDGPATGGGPWPLDAGVSAAGVDVVVTAWGTGGVVTDLRSGTTEPVDVEVAADTDNDANAIEARVPRSILEGASNIRVWAATGLWDRDASTWMAVPVDAPTATAPGNGSPTVAARAWNVAFRPNDTGVFVENAQAAALAKGDITEFHSDVDLDELTAGVDKPATFVPGHFYDVILDERTVLGPGEGVSYTGLPGRFTGVNGAALTQHFDFFGRYQPYGLYVPSTYRRESSIPAALVLHGIGGSFDTYNTRPGFIADMGEGGDLGLPPMFLITPLGRGSSFYADWGEDDTLRVLDDVLTHFPVDRTRLYLTGYSMGGYGVYRLASLHPDWFAAAASWAGYTGEFTGSYGTETVLGPAGVSGGNRGKANIGDPVNTLENLRYLPLVHLGGTNDEIVPTPGQYAAPRRLSELGYRSRYDLYPGYEHFSFALVDDWKQVRRWLGDHRIGEIPPRQVTYKFSDGWTEPGLADELGLVHDGAYWLHGLTMRVPTTDGLVLAAADATTFGLPAQQVTVQRTSTADPAPTPNVQQLVSWDLGAPLAQENRIELRFTNVGTATVDLAAAGLHACGLTVVLATDGPSTVRLLGDIPQRAHAAERGDSAITVEDDEIVLAVDGNHSTTITCPGAPAGV